MGNVYQLLLGSYFFCLLRRALLRTSTEYLGTFLFTFVSDMDKMWFSKWLKKEISVCKPFYSIQRRKIWWLLQEKLCTHMYSNEGKADCKSRSMWYKAKAFMTNCKEVVKCTPSGKDYGPETTKSWTAMRTWPCLTSKFFCRNIQLIHSKKKVEYLNYRLALSLCISTEVWQGTTEGLCSKGKFHYNSG